MKTNRSPVFVVLVYVLLASALIATTWAAVEMARADFATEEAAAEIDLDQPLRPRRTYYGLVLGFGGFVCFVLAYAAGRRSFFRVGPNTFEKHVSVYGIDRRHKLVFEESCVLDYVDDGNGNGHYRVRARTEKPRLLDAIIPWRSKEDGSWVTLWYHKREELSQHLATWLNQVRGLRDPIPDERGDLGQEPAG